MKIKRLAASINAYFDDFVTRVENHDAVAKVAIEDVQKAAAKIRSEKNRVDQRAKRLNEEKQNYESAILRWKERAKSCVASDEAKALECLKQVKVLETQLQHTTLQFEEMQQLAVTLGANLNSVERKLDELQNKRALLASRETRATVNCKTNQQLGALDVDNIFDRWELNIMEKEYNDGASAFNDKPSTESNDLAKNFEEAEEQEGLLAELLVLKAQVEQQGEKGNE